MLVRKRDGRIVLWDDVLIATAIQKAIKETKSDVDGNIPALLAAEVRNGFMPEWETVDVEMIQDAVVEALKRAGLHDVAKKYTSYRNRRTRIRRNKSDLICEIGRKVMATDVSNQNANVDEHSFGGRRGEAADALLKQYALDNCMSETARTRHINNEIYIHDLNSYAVGMHNCMSIPFDDLLANGFKTRQTDVRPANSINTAFQLVAVIFQLQSLCQFGGCSATHLDWTMVPYVRKSFYKHYVDGVRYCGGRHDFQMVFNPDAGIDSDMYSYGAGYIYAVDMTQRELKQAVEGMYHNLNTLQSRAGDQLPFTSINYGTCTLPEGRMVIRALLEGSLNGVGAKHLTPVFPCGIFQMMRGINREEGDPNYDLYRLALESTAKRLYPNYANIDWSGNIGYDKEDPRTYFATMGCRTANGFDINGLGQQKDGRGNICPVTIILPTLAMEAKDSIVDDVWGGQPNPVVVDVFMDLLDRAIHDAKDMLVERFEYICSQDPKSAPFMWENNVMAGYIPEEGIRSALRHGTLAVGQLGLAECLQILIGKDHTTPEGMALAKRIERLFTNRCGEFKEECKLNFGVYYSPAENLCHTAMKKFRERYGVIENVSDHEYFTNSMHVPVWKKMTPKEKIDIESKLTGYSSAGCITYIELESGVKNNLEALDAYVQYAMDKDIPYFAVNVPNDECVDCGYTDEFNDCCPMCGSYKILQLRRVTGYLSTDWRHFNAGKQQEVKDRVKHSEVVKDVSEYRGG